MYYNYSAEYEKWFSHIRKPKRKFFIWDHPDKECAVAKGKKYIAQVWLIVTTAKKNNS